MTVSRRRALQVLAAGGVAAGGAVVASRAQASKEALPPVPPDARGLLFDSTLCVGCQTCTVACQRANAMPLDKSVEIINGAPYDFPEDLNGYNRTVIKLFKSGDRWAFYKNQCNQCLEPSCVMACMLGAMQKRQFGVVTWDPLRCTGCRYCQISCPYNVPKFQFDVAIPRITKCELCLTRKDGKSGPACAEVCPRHAVITGTRDEILAIARARMAESPGRYNERIFGEKDGGGNQSLLLAPAGIAWTDFGLPELGEVPPTRLAMNVQHTAYKGFIAPIALYVAAAFAIFRSTRAERKAEKEKGEKP